MMPLPTESSDSVLIDRQMQGVPKRSLINVAKGILIILVVFGHFGQTVANVMPRSVAPAAQGVILTIYSFHMPAFLFVSGFLSQNLEKRRNKTLTGLLIPFIVYQLVVGLAMMVITGSTDALEHLFTPQMGAWYLLTLFTYRLLLPNLIEIRGLFFVAVCLSIFRGCLTGVRDGFALQWTICFFPFFLAGFYVGNRSDSSSVQTSVRMPLALSITVFVIAYIGFVVLSCRDGAYRDALLLLTNSLTSTTVDWWMTGILYCGRLLLSSVLIVAFFSAIPRANAWLEKVGEDTMPLYLSHLILFMAVHLLVDKGNAFSASIISIIAATFSVIVFSLTVYRSWFHSVLGHITRLICAGGDSSAD